MSLRFPFFVALLSVTLFFTGCGKDETDTAAAQSDATEQADAAPTENPAAEGDHAPDAEPAPSAEAAPAQTGPIKDVALAPTADENPMKTAFVFYSAKDKAPALAEFHKKDLESKGWKATRNDVNKLPGTTLGGAIQRFEKGSDVLTVVVAEQPGADGNVAMVAVMDLPLPAETLYAVAYGGQMNGEMSLAPADAIAWFTKDLAARGWTADAPKESGGTHSVNFRKGQRTLATQFRAAAPGKTGSTFYFMHIG